MIKRSTIGLFAFGLAALGASSQVLAGEVTGGPHPRTTPINSYVAHSICSFSGQEDGLALVGFDEFGAPIFVRVETGAGYVQTPHQENAAGIIHEPGSAGTACRGNL